MIPSGELPAALLWFVSTGAESQRGFAVTVQSLGRRSTFDDWAFGAAISANIFKRFPAEGGWREEAELQGC